MGHDISASYSTKPTAPIATLRISGKQRHNIKLYKALSAEEYNKLASGSGDTKAYELGQITNARNYLIKHKADPDEIKFMCDVLRSAERDNKKKVHILFD